MKIPSSERWPLAALAITWATFFSRILSGKYVYFLDDLKIIYYPLEIVYAQAQNSFSLPLWSNLFGMGQPILAWGQLGFFTPVHMLLRLLQVDPLNLLQLSVLIYFALGLWGMYWFVRRLGLSAWPAVAGAVVYVFSGFNIGHLNHVNFYTATMLLPWLLLAIHWFLVRPTIRRAVIMSLVASAMTISAQPQVVVYCFAIGTILGVAIFFVRNKLNLSIKSVQVTALTVLAGLLALMLSSFAVLPLQEFLPITERAGDLPRQELYEFSYPASHAITLISPYHFGGHDNYTGAKGFQELAAFTGIVPLLLAAFALLHWKKNKTIRAAGLFLVLLGITFAIGKYSPIYRLLVDNHWWPGFNIPGRFVFFFDTGIALLAALALQDLITKKYGKNWMIVGLVLVSAANLIYFAWDYNPVVKRSQAVNNVPLVDELKSDAQIPPRLYSRDTILIKPHSVAPPEVSEDPESLLLARHLNVAASTSGGRWIGALSVRNYRAFIEDFFANDRETRDGDDIHVVDKNRAVFDMAGVTHFAQLVPNSAQDAMEASNFNILQSLPYENAKLRLYDNPQVFPKAWLVQEAIFLTGPEQTRHAMTFDDFDPTRMAFVSGDKPPANMRTYGDIGPEEMPQNLKPATGTVEITEYTDTKVALKTNAAEKSWLIMSDTTTPEWLTYIDGEPAPQYLAYTFMKAALVPAGEHEVEFRYESPAIKRASRLTLGGIIIVIVLLIIPAWKRKNTGS